MGIILENLVRMIIIPEILLRMRIIIRKPSENGNQSHDSAGVLEKQLFCKALLLPRSSESQNFSEANITAI